jgi:hypothetical protein
MAWEMGFAVLADIYFRTRKIVQKQSPHSRWNNKTLSPLFTRKTSSAFWIFTKSQIYWRERKRERVQCIKRVRWCMVRERKVRREEEERRGGNFNCVEWWCHFHVNGFIHFWGGYCCFLYWRNGIKLAVTSSSRPNSNLSDSGSLYHFLS